MRLLKEVSSGKQDQTLKTMQYKQASTLSAFVGVNIVSVHEVAGALDTTKSRVTELDTSLETIKDTMESESRKEALEIEWIHRDEIQKQLQIQEKELKEEFNKTTSLN
jgi:hypothetical protein